MTDNKLSRRAMLTKTAAGLGALAVAGQFNPTRAVSSLFTQDAPLQLKGRLKQSVARWCYDKIPIDDLAKASAAMGIKGIDLIGPADWPTVKKYGLIPTMVTGGGTIPDGLNNPKLHDKIEKEFAENIPRAAEAEVPNVITFSGNRKGMNDWDAMENCVAGLNRVKALAEKHNVTICFELLNSKVNHIDYQFDHMEWGVAVVRRVNSPRVKILYDIYHAQIMDGDIIATIKKHHQWIGHYHTGGVPGRHEIDITQETNYRPIAQAIVETGFNGYMAHEFVPAGSDPLASLRAAVQLCDV